MEALDPSNLVPSVTYSDEIRDMMFAFGDSIRPKRETAEILEELVLEQMREILFRAQEVAERRQNAQIGLEELLFLQRRQPVKVQRLLKYLSVRDTAATFQALSGDNVNVECKRVKKCKDFLRRIDTDGSLIKATSEELQDEVRMERLRRMDRLSRDLDERKYAEFSRARQVSFLGAKMNKNVTRFHDWLLSETQSWFHMTVDRVALEIFSYFAYETVGHLVEMALIVRKESEYTWDPVLKVMGPKAVNPQFPMVQLKQASDLNKGKALPEIPTSLNPDGENSPLRQRLKSGGGSNEPECMSQGALEPDHVREAYRRLNQRPSLFAWFRQVDARHQNAESRTPILVL